MRAGVGVHALCSSFQNSQGINNSVPAELAEARSGCLVYGFRAGHKHPFYVKYSFLNFKLRRGELKEERRWYWVRLRYIEKKSFSNSGR